MASPIISRILILKLQKKSFTTCLRFNYDMLCEKRYSFCKLSKISDWYDSNPLTWKTVVYDRVIVKWPTTNKPLRAATCMLIATWFSKQTCSIPNNLTCCNVLCPDLIPGKYPCHKRSHLLLFIAFFGLLSEI